MTEAQENNAQQAEQPTSPLIKLLAAFGMGKKPAPQSTAPTATPVVVSKAPASKTSANAPDPAQPPAGPLVAVVTRNQFYRDGFRNLMKIALIEGIVIVGLILTLIVFIGTAEPKDRYFATTADGRIMPILPMEIPSKQTAELMSWVAQSTADIMTFGFHDYQQRLQDSSKYFTRRGWETFTQALQKSKIIDSVVETRQVINAQPLSAPILIQQGVFNGRYRWMVEMPLQLSYKGTTQGRTDVWKLTLIIDRVPSLENADGIGIEQWLAAPQR